MKRWVGAALILTAGFLTTTRGQQSTTPPGPEYVPGEVLIHYARNATVGRRDSVLSNRRARLLARLDQLDIDHVQLASGESVEGALTAFRGFAEVASVQPNYVRHTVQAQSPPPNDPKWLDGSLYGLVKIQAQSAWNLGFHGDGTVVVADIDTGINYNHQDLAANVWTNPGEIAGDHIDNDHNGYVDDIHGIDTVNGDTDPIDDNGHGTHTAGTIAAVGNNGVGVVGVNWNAKVLSCKFLNSSGSGSDAGAAACLNYIVDLKQNHHINIRVTNNSWGGYGGNPSVLQTAFEAAYHAGIISFAAAGNDSLNIDSNVFYPASLSLDPLSGVVAVASSDSSDNRSSFSNYGVNTVSLAAPGSSILSTYTGAGNNVYATLSGTSMATPHVAGTAALLSSMDPTLNVDQLKAIITGNVDVLPAFGGITVTGGRLNAFKAASTIGGGGGATAAFVTTDLTTQGNWQGVYGRDGYSLEGDAQSLPAYASFAPIGAQTYTWAASTSDPRALQRPAGGRIAATWYNNPSFQLDVNVGASPHQVALYCVDFDTTLRGQQIDVLDAGTSAVLDTRTVTSFNGGEYLVWNISGHVRFRITRLSGFNGVVSGIFFGGADQAPTVTLTGPPDNSTYVAPATVPLSATASDPDQGDTIDHVTFFANGTLIGTSSTPVQGVYSFSWTNVAANSYSLTAQAFDSHGLGSPISNVSHIVVSGGGGGATAAFVTTDLTTQGNWQGVYGRDGYSLEGDAQSLPAYATFAPIGAQTYTWAASTSDPRALQRPAGGRIAATWYNNPSFQLDVNVGASPHQVALYCVDFDTTARGQQIDVLDAGTSAVLDTRTVTSFNGGEYLVWNISGHVQFRVTRLSGFNGVVSGIFFGGADQAPTVSLTGPPDNSTYVAPATVPLSATASDPDQGDTIDHVTFFANGTPIGTSSTPVQGVFSFSWTNVAANSYSLTAQAFDNHGLGSPISNVSHIVVSGGGGGASATFTGFDTTTQGAWIGVRGGDGYSLADDATSLPGYAVLSQNGQMWPWAESTSDLRALQRAGGLNGRVAATWYGTALDLDLNLTDGLTHEVSIYSVDFDFWSRSQRVDVFDAVSNALLDTEIANGLANGEYLSWNVRGHVRFHLTILTGPNVVVSGVFFGPAGPSNHPSSATLIGPWNSSNDSARISVPPTATASDPDVADAIHYIGLLGLQRSGWGGWR